LTRIPVETASRSYEVSVERGLLRRAAGALRDLLPEACKIVIVSSQPILDLWGDALAETLAHLSCSTVVLILPDGESAKRLTNIEKLASGMVAVGVDRRSVVIALGGGVVGDVAGFLASVYMRGIPVVQIPTTLVAQVDSAIGGKTGVNLRSGKNLVGTFHQPLAVLADPDVLSTLPEREYRSGLFEAMKYGVIRNPAIFEVMESQREAILRRDADLRERLVTDCIKAKAEVVSADERESGERRILNFGHTIGHTLEAATRYKHFLHGEAVGWGMIAAAVVGRETGITSPDLAKRITALVSAYGPLPAVAVKGKRILQLLQADKKTIGGVPHFVLARDIGRVEIVNTVSEKAVLRAAAEITRLSSK
jgi:3-dehydroquinate synthase